VDGDQKTIVGDLGAIDKMLSLIDSRLQRNICDEVMETAWSTMWNVTGLTLFGSSSNKLFINFSLILDETPVNCERFLDNNGMDYFVSCMHSFPQSAGMLLSLLLKLFVMNLIYY